MTKEKLTELLKQCNLKKAYFNGQRYFCFTHNDISKFCRTIVNEYGVSIPEETKVNISGKRKHLPILNK